MNKSRDDPDISRIHIMLCYVSYGIIILFSYIAEFFDIVTGRQSSQFKTKKGYAPLLKAWDSFYTRRMFWRIRDCWNRPVSGVPGSYIKVQERSTEDHGDTFKYTGKDIECLNLGSYNYLAFSDNKGRCLEDVQECIKKYGISTNSTMCDIGTTKLHRAVELKTAQFLNKEDCIIFDMGYHTNASSIQCMVGKGCLIISDSLNHASLVAGCRTSGAKVIVFPHNDVVALDKLVRESIAKGQPRTHRPWKKNIDNC